MDLIKPAILRDSNLAINRTTLKLIAIITMLIDHIGYILYPEIEWLRWIGRIAFPIFVFQLVEGYKKTSDLKKYFMRLLFFAFISEIPFDLAFFGEPFFWEYQNVYFELVLCLLSLVLLDKTNEASTLVRWVSIFSVCIASILLRADYNTFGILLAVLFYLYKDNFVIYALGMCVFSYVFNNTMQLFCLFSLPFIMMYNENIRSTKLSKPVQFMFYAFYPLHIFILYVVKMLFFS